MEINCKIFFFDQREPGLESGEWRLGKAGTGPLVGEWDTTSFGLTHSSKSRGSRVSTSGPDRRPKTQNYLEAGLVIMEHIGTPSRRLSEMG